jgi:hypothetical protein
VHALNVDNTSQACVGTAIANRSIADGLAPGSTHLQKLVIIRSLLGLVEEPKFLERLEFGFNALGTFVIVAITYANNEF